MTALEPLPVMTAPTKERVAYLDNARYWYSQAGRPYRTVPLDAERAEIAAELLAAR